MQFNSIDFMVFFPVVLALYFIVPRKCRGLWLLIASYYFYMSWNAKYAVLIGGSTIITYVCGLLVELFSKDDIKNGRRKQQISLAICLIVNLGILAIFKYGNFTIESINTLLKVLHITMINRRFDFLLPVGISFYTFQALGYSIDVYRGEIDAEKNLLRYALFVSFFPQLVAGPIERSKNLLGQMRKIEEIKLWNARRVTSGAILMVWGFFMKMVISDRVALVVDNVFDNYRMYGSSELILAALGFTLQIYCDFGSYSIIAIGAAKIMGFELMENFNTPYFARNIRDFWSRWHISLSTWFKDYLYIPLGGNRKGKVRKAINVMIVFLVSGLWHGANWSFVMWGGIHGAYQVIADFLYTPRKARCEKLKIKTDCISWKLLQTFITFVLVVFAWIFFRADTITDAIRFCKRIIVKPTPWLLFNGGLYELGLDRVEMNILIVSIVILILVDLVRYLKKQTLDQFLFDQNIWFEWLVIIVLLMMIFTFGEYGPSYNPQQFIYFQF
ncbi:MBOAT family O-acyltransferase [Pseudobutyrivibrio xylanivorans]|uniref:D-alanyl-lipoteichoic acid acyltransferase DltB, MBOAT superfamily n=1 Tax=Pseudobutyrivibrio xylanivorans TaxID=185007 RepID=A0A1G5RWY5_PSEXY|nr:MBOAT family O-acyltransferase [Pseudobutyrivibrio xylanivorans]SCZ78624.1 D-alanyl-lipoteichoic acid acyltransferase DltB, MBOAT superfamily [Pseudobutyrivibrio xylanivorans]